MNYAVNTLNSLTGGERLNFIWRYQLVLISFAVNTVNGTFSVLFISITFKMKNKYHPFPGLKPLSSKRFLSFTMYIKTRGNGDIHFPEDSL